MRTAIATLAVVALLSVPAAAQCVTATCQAAPVCQVESSPLCVGGGTVITHCPVARIVVRAPVVVSHRVIVRVRNIAPLRRIACWRPLRRCCR